MMEILIRDGKADLERTDKYNNTAFALCYCIQPDSGSNFLRIVALMLWL